MKMTYDHNKIVNRIRKMAMAEVSKSAIEIQKIIQGKLNLSASNIGNGGTPSTKGSPPANRTGALMRSIQAVNVTVNPSIPTWRVGTKIKYARIQEFGGTVEAKKHKFLTIPIGRDGQRAATKAKGDLWSLHLTPIREKGKLYLAEVRYVGGNIKTKVKFLFLLVKSVYLPARPYFRPAIAEFVAKKHMEWVSARINK